MSWRGYLEQSTTTALRHHIGRCQPLVLAGALSRVWPGHAWSRPAYRISHTHSHTHIHTARASKSIDLCANSSFVCDQIESHTWTMQGSSNVASTSALQSEASRKRLWQPSTQDQAPGPLHPSQQEQQQQHADFLHGEDGDPHHPTKILQRSRTPTVSPDDAPCRSCPVYSLLTSSGLNSQAWSGTPLCVIAHFEFFLQRPSRGGGGGLRVPIAAP